VREPGTPAIGQASNTQPRRPPIHIKTLLNKLHPIKRFVYAKVEFEQVRGRAAIVAEIRPRKGSLARCSGCGKARPGYDRCAKARLFRFVPLWNTDVHLSYRMRRVDCPGCGVTVETIPWASGKHSCCDVMRLFLSRWARRLSWKETAECFRVPWDTVRRSVAWTVRFGLKNRCMDGIEALGIDEVAYGVGHKYMTLVYQIDKGSRRLLGVLEGRTIKTMVRYFRDFGKERCERVKVVCTDMWHPYLKVVAKKLTNALNVLDRFHIAKKLGEAVDQVRREEVAKLHKEGYEPVLKNARYCFLKRVTNLTSWQSAKLADLLRCNLRSVRAYLLKESFDAFWAYDHPRWARWFLRKWCARAMRSRLEPFKKFVRTLRKHEALLMNYFLANKEFNSGIVEGLNLKINLSIRKAYGYKSFDIMKMALFHQHGDLPEPEFTHRFCE